MYLVCTQILRGFYLIKFLLQVAQSESKWQMQEMNQSGAPARQQQQPWWAQNHSRESPNAGVEDGRAGQGHAADPDDQEDDSGAGLGHPRLQRVNDCDVPERNSGTGCLNRVSIWSQNMVRLKRFTNVFSQLIIKWYRKPAYPQKSDRGVLITLIKDIYSFNAGNELGGCKIWNTKCSI